MDTLKHGMVWWTELCTWNIEEALKFYKEVMGYEFDEMDMGDEGTYYTAMVGDIPAVGMFYAGTTEMDKNIPSHWFTYFKIDNMDKSIEQIKNSGGSVIREPFEVPNVGLIAIVAGVDGSVFGVGVPAE